MRQMFQSATAFNQDIGSWNVGSLTDMTQMFQSATTFNQDIGSWNVSNVTTLFGSFTNTTAFNQDMQLGRQWCNKFKCKLFGALHLIKILVAGIQVVLQIWPICFILIVVLTKKYELGSPLMLLPTLVCFKMRRPWLQLLLE